MPVEATTVTLHADVKERLESERNKGESYNDVLERLFGAARDRDRDLLAGAGFWSSETAERARETREAFEEKSIDRMRRRSEDT